MISTEDWPWTSLVSSFFHILPLHLVSILLWLSHFKLFIRIQQCYTTFNVGSIITSYWWDSECAFRKVAYKQLPDVEWLSEIEYFSLSDSIAEAVLRKEEIRHSILFPINTIYNSRCISSGFKSSKYDASIMKHEFLISLLENECYTSLTVYELCKIWRCCIHCLVEHHIDTPRSKMPLSISRVCESKPEVLWLCFGWLSAAIYRVSRRIFIDSPEINSAAQDE